MKQNITGNKMNIDLSKMKQRLEDLMSEHEVDTNLLVDFYLAEHLPGKLFMDVNKNAMRLAILYKAYILAVAEDDKEKRIDIMKAIKRRIENLPAELKSFKSLWEHLNKDNEEETKSNSE